MISRPRPTFEELHCLLEYDQATGNFTWKPRPNNKAWSTRRAGKPAGRAKPNGVGYLEIAIYGRLFRTHTLAWLYQTGEWPVSQIDHINGNKIDNRFCNLRLATPAQNGWNVKKTKRNTSGYKGVFWSRVANKFAAQVSVSSQRISLGYFNSAKEAHQAYCKAISLYHGKYARAD